MDIKRQEIVYNFFKINCFKGENEKCFENSFPLYERAEAPSLSLSHTICVFINSNYFRNKTPLRSFM